MMTTQTLETPQTNAETSERYARCIAASKRVRWDIDRDIIRGRTFNFEQKFLPDALSKVQGFDFLTPAGKRQLSQIQCRTYSHMFHLAERFVNAKVLELSQDHWFGDQTALEALVRFSDEELKHQEMFRRIEQLAAAQMIPGYTFLPDANEVAKVVLNKSTWAVLALTLCLELISQVHFRQSLDRDPDASPMFKDVLRYHWVEESQHAIMDELEWERVDQPLSWEDRDRAVDEFIELIFAVDDILQTQAKSESEYFARTCVKPLRGDQNKDIENGILKAYREQYIFSGAHHPHFQKVIGGFISERQAARIHDTLQGLS